MYEYNAKIVSVVDGDTFDLDIDLGFHIHVHERVRLLDVDTPETTARVSEEDKRNGLIVKAWAKEYLTGLDCRIQSEKQDSFGRWLVNLRLKDNGKDLRDWYNNLGFNKKNENYKEDDDQWVKIRKSDLYVQEMGG